MNSDDAIDNQADCEGGLDGDWYCEDHPERLMGHDGCGGAGIVSSDRIHMLSNKLRLAKQEVREANKMRDELGFALKRLLDGGAGGT